MEWLFERKWLDIRENQVFTCSQDEWYLARIYSQFAFGEGKYLTEERNSTIRISVSILLIIVSFFILINVSPSEKVAPYEYVVSIVVLLVGSFFLIRGIYHVTNNKYHYLSKPSISAKDVTLYRVTDKGITINHFNRKDYDIFISWEDVSYMSIGNMEYEIIRNAENGIEYGSMRRKLKREMKRVRKEFPKFSFDEPLLVHEDKRSVYLGASGGHVAHLPIPASWEENGEADRFITTLQNHTRYLSTEDKKQIFKDSVVTILDKTLSKTEKH